MDVVKKGSTAAKGFVTYLSLRNALLVVATQIGSLTVAGSTATLEATAFVNGKSGYRCTVTIVEGRPDAFGIVIRKPDGKVIYDHRQAATDGNLKIVGRSP